MEDKYNVFRKDGRKDQEARYIVLRVDEKAKDKEAAIEAAILYKNKMNSKIGKERIEKILNGELSNNPFYK